MKHLLLLLSLMINLDALGAEELNQVAHRKCKLRSGNDYNDCYRYYSRIYPIRNSNPISSNDTHLPLIVNLQDFGEPSSNIADKDFLRLHLKLMHAYWLEHARKRGLNLPFPILRLDDGYLMGCGKRPVSKSPNIYCPDSSEITLDVRPLIKGSSNRASLNLSYLSLAILSHEFGHHVNQHIGREKYRGNEENEADWRAGRYLAYVISNKLMPLEGLTTGANLFFSVGDFHLHSAHSNPKGRFKAFMNGFNDESMGIGSFAGEWLQDTNETFSKRIHKSYSVNTDMLYFDVYRFEIDRSRQITGNIFAGIIGVLNCSQGSKEDCANSLLYQGKAMPEGWFRKQQMIIQCQRNTFDIEGDEFKSQPINSDRKGQAQYLSQRDC